MVLAIASKNVILSLFFGGLTGALIFCGGNPFAAVHSMIGDYFFVQLTDSYNAGVIAFVCYLVAGVTRSPLTVLLAVVLQLAVIFIWNRMDVKLFEKKA